MTVQRVPAALPGLGINMNPTATTSLVGVMMGMGATVQFTPQVSGNVLVMWTGGAGSNVGVVQVVALACHGTGTAPVNGAAQTGSDGLGVAPIGPAVGVVHYFAITYKLAGLVIGTKYWFDMSLLTGNAADPAILANMQCVVMELPF